MQSKIRIRVGAVEVEYEGTETFLKKELPRLLATVGEAHAKCSVQSGPSNADNGGPAVDPSPAGEPGSVRGTTTTIAGILKCKTGKDLAIAAAARLSLGLNKTPFDRAAILTEMKSASGYFKENHRKNLSNILGTLVKAGTFVEPSAGDYELAAAERQRLEQALARSG